MHTLVMGQVVAGVSTCTRCQQSMHTNWQCPASPDCCCSCVLCAATCWLLCVLQNDMESLEMQGMPPGMYHRYGVLDDDMDEEDDDNADHAGGFSNAAGSSGAGVYTADMLVAGMAGLGVQDPDEAAEASGAAAGQQGVEGAADGSNAPAGQGSWSLMAHPGEL